jgi:hypothetical protein
VRNLAVRAGWLTQAPARAEILHRLRRNCTTPASLHFVTTARYARQAIGRPPPPLAGARSAFLPTARRAPLSHNGPWWVVATRFEGVHPLPTTTIMRSGLHFAPLGGGCPSTPVLHGSCGGVRERVGQAATAPTHPRPRGGNRYALPPRRRPRKKEQAPRAKPRRRTDSEDLGREDLGRPVREDLGWK